ncbi:MAG: efflux RND transporter permease subunit [Nitrospinales bacterium]
MERITQFAITNARATILAMLFIVLLGLQTFITMPSQEDPEIKIRNAQVSVYFPGMPGHIAEDQIAKLLEKKIKQIPEIEEIHTTISSGKVLIQPKVYDRYFHLDSIWQDLRNKMNDIKKDLPEGSIGPIVNDDFGRVSVATIAMTGDGFDMKEMGVIARNMQDRISSMDSVSKVDVMGVQQERIYLDINSARVANYGLSFANLVQALTNQNVVLPGGSINADGRVIVIEPSGNFESIEEIKNIQVQVPDTGQVVYLQDIVNVRRSFVDPPANAAFFNNKPAVIIAVSMVPRYNIEDFGKEITAKVNELQNELPIGLVLDYATYQPTLVTAAVTSAVNNLYQTIAVVLAVVILFLGFRTGLIVGATVPLTILLSVIAMNIWGIDLQRMSIAAIIIALGLLVDNAIVIAEDMSARMAIGTSKKDAAIKAVQSLGVPLLTSSLTTILAFTPLILADDVSSEYLRSLAQVITTTLIASWFLALFATPVLCYWFLRDNKSGVDEDSQYENFFYKIYRSMLKGFLRFRILFTILMIAGLVFSVMGLSILPKQMMPYSDRNQFLIYLDLPAGTHIDETTRVTRSLSEWLSNKQANPNIKNHVAYMGYGGPRFFLAVAPPDPGDNVAFMVVNTETSKDVQPLLKKVDNYIIENIPEVRGRAKAMSLGAGEIGLVEYRIIGPDITTLYRLARTVENEMNGIEGTVGVMNDWNEPVIRTRVEIDQDRASRAGVTSKSIASALDAYYEGINISDFRENDQALPIVIRGDSTRDDWSELRVLPIMSENGEPVPLIQVADFKAYAAPSKFRRYNQERTIIVSGKHYTKQATDLHEIIWPFIQTIKLPEGFRVEIGGEVEGSEKSNGALAGNFPLVMMGILVLLILQFNSFRRSAIIILTIPLVVIGAVLGLIVSKAFFSFTAILGLYSLVGIIVNNGIVLIDRIDTDRNNGLGVNEAILKACIARVRPILMTAMTTILGLIPLALFGGDMWFPMAVVIMGGLAVGTILSLGFVPVLYSLFFRESKPA